MSELAVDHFQMLRTVVLQQSLQGDFPSWLVSGILAIAEAPERYANQVDLVQRLVWQISEYDPYAGAGCFDAGVSAAMIEATIRQIVS